MVQTHWKKELEGLVALGLIFKSSEFSSFEVKNGKPRDSATPGNLKLEGC